jgi:multicomponent Na+:H+ antiporter subunit D
MAASGSYPAVDIAAAMVTTAPTAAEWLVILPVIVPMVAGALIVMLRHMTALHGRIAAVALGALLIVDVLLLREVAANGPVVMMMGSWLPPFGIAFEADLIGVTFATTAALVALAVVMHADASIDTAERRYGYHAFLMLMMSGVSGAFLTGDIFNLYVWFEVLLISSFGLMVLGSEDRQIDATVKYGVLNLIATTLFLIAVALLYGTHGTLNMADIAMKARAGTVPGPTVTIAALFLVAFAMKAAAFPLNAWLPASYHAPGAEVSALFAGLLTKVGVYALLKVLILLIGPEALQLSSVAAWIAGLTMVVGALGALAQSEMRRMLNWLVIAGIGNMLIGLALPDTAALTGAVFYAVHSMLVMAALYLVAGIVEEIAGTGDLRRLGGLWSRQVWFAGLLLLLLFAVAGLPPLSGFWPKAMLVDASLAGGAPWLAAAVLVSGFLTTLAAGRLFLYAAWRGGPEGTADGVVDGDTLALPRASLGRIAPALLLTLPIIAIGLVPEPLHRLAAGAAAGLVDPASYIDAVFGSVPAGSAAP